MPIILVNIVKILSPKVKYYSFTVKPIQQQYGTLNMSGTKYFIQKSIILANEM